MEQLTCAGDIVGPAAIGELAIMARRVMKAFYRSKAARHNAILTDDTPHIWGWFTVVHRL